MQDEIQLELLSLQKHNAEGNFHKIEMESASTFIWLDDSKNSSQRSETSQNLFIAWLWLLFTDFVERFELGYAIKWDNIKWG